MGGQGEGDEAEGGKKQARRHEMGLLKSMAGTVFSITGAQLTGSLSPVIRA
jgi:hypothetical protein